MDRAGQYYIYFLLAVSALTAGVRLGMPRLYAQMESERLRVAKARRKRVWIGTAVILLSPAILVYRFWGPLRPWMWLTLGVGVLSGAEQFTSVHCREFPRMLWHTRVFGLLSALVALTIYLFFVRHGAG